MTFDVTFQELEATMAVRFGEVVNSPFAVLYKKQNLTEEQKAQARDNIGVAGKATENGGAVFGNESNKALCEASIAAGDMVMRSDAEYAENAQGKVYVVSADCELAKREDVISIGYEVISLEELNNGTDTYVLTSTGGYCLKADARYNEAVGSGSTANGLGAISFARASKSLGYRTQTGYPPSGEYLERRPELQSKQIKIPDCSLSYGTEVASGINVSAMAGVALQHKSFINVVNSNSSIVNFYIRFIFENESGEVGSFEYLLTEGVTQTISCDVPGGATLLRIESDRTLEIYRNDIFCLRNALLTLCPQENIGQGAVATGADTAALENHAYAGGLRTLVKGINAFGHGRDLVIAGEGAFGTGVGGKALEYGAFTCGDQNTSSMYNAFTCGAHNEASNSNAFVGGTQNISGIGNQAVFGKYNVKRTDAMLVVGNGTSASRNNALVVKTTGEVLADGAFTPNGADYAEFFEWQDGNPNAEDRIGLLVTLEGEKIRPAMPSDDVLGIVSGTVAVLGDSAAMHWKDKYLTDEYGRTLYDMVEEFIETVDGNTGDPVRISAGVMPQPRLNPEYNPDSTYIPREDRQEWDKIGMMGKLYVREDGTCSAGDYGCAGENGILTRSETPTNIRVMKRTSDNIVLVLLK